MSAGPYRNSYHDESMRDQDDDGYEFDFNRGLQQQQQPNQSQPSRIVEEVDESERVLVPHGTSYAMTSGEVDEELVNGPNYSSFGPTAPGGESRREAELRRVLHEEFQREYKRNEVLAGVVDERERQRLARIFGVERKAAREQIMALSNH